MANPNPKFDENWILPLLNVWSILAYAALSFWLSLGEAKEDITVIYDTGTASPLSDFVKAPKLAVPEGLPEINLQASDGFAAQLFPIHTPELSPGEVNAQTTQLLLPQPFFIIGCDGRSKQWLNQFKDRLSQIGAVGLVVEADNLAEFQALSEVAQGLRLSPVPASQLAKQLGISHYPVLVTASRIEQ